MVYILCSLLIITYISDFLLIHPTYHTVIAPAVDISRYATYECRMLKTICPKQMLSPELLRSSFIPRKLYLVTINFIPDTWVYRSTRVPRKDYIETWNFSTSMNSTSPLRITVQPFWNWDVSIFSNRLFMGYINTHIHTWILRQDENTLCRT